MLTKFKLITINLISILIVKCQCQYLKTKKKIIQRPINNQIYLHRLSEVQFLCSSSLNIHQVAVVAAVLLSVWNVWLKMTPSGEAKITMSVSEKHQWKMYRAQLYGGAQQHGKIITLYRCSTSFYFPLFFQAMYSACHMMILKSVRSCLDISMGIIWWLLSSFTSTKLFPGPHVVHSTSQSSSTMATVWSFSVCQDAVLIISLF